MDISVEKPEFTDKRSAAIVQSRGVVDPLLSVMDKLANNPNLDADKIERLLNVYLDGQRKMAAMADEKAFADAMADFKKNPPDIVKTKTAAMRKADGTVSYTYNYADLDAFASAAQAGLAERGITWSFPFSEKEGSITVSCILRYGLYTHTPTTLSSPPDATGGKNAIQAKASTISYLERYTFCGATGLTAGMPDVDGSDKPRLSEDTRKRHLEALESASTHDTLKKVWQEASKAAQEIKDSEALQEFVKLKDRRYKEIAATAKAQYKEIINAPAH